MRKNTKTIKAFCTILPSTRGARAQKKNLNHGYEVYNTVCSTYLGAGYEEKRASEEGLSIQRAMALKVCSAYKTVSTEAVLVTVALITLDILARQRKALNKKRPEINADMREKLRKDTITIWQEQWRVSTEGRWTFRLIKNIEKWLSRGHGQMSYRLTEVFTDHGHFTSFLANIGKKRSTKCLYCDRVKEDAERTLFVCARRNQDRNEVERKVETTLITW